MSDQNTTPPAENTPPANDAEQNRMPPPLFYKEPRPVTADAHGDFKIRPTFDFAHANQTNAVPLTLPEFVLSARHYPIVFVGKDLVPTAALGFRPDQNVFVDDKGTWEKFCYVPAYVRRYPFILLGRPGDERLQLGIDHEAKSSASDARALFNGEKETETVTEALDMCQQFHGAYQATAEFSNMLKESGLMEERTLEVDIAEGEKIDIGAFASINEQKLREVPDETFLEWRKKGWLAAMYFHVASLNNWEQIMGRLPEAQQKNPAALTT
ncbi:MAG: SapC family protein [Rhodospirillaceae bacterium]